MKIIRFNELIYSDRAIEFTGGISLRGVLRSDGMGFSVNKTIIPKGGPYKWHYPHHLEACYCIKGRGILRVGNIEHLITQDVCYLVNEHEIHTFEAITDVVLISIFNPPLVGPEKHNKDGKYELL